MRVDPDYSCPICIDPIQLVVSMTACNHAFHCDCITKSFQYNNTCPLCRRPLMRNSLFINKCKNVVTGSEWTLFSDKTGKVVSSLPFSLHGRATSCTSTYACTR